MNKKPKVEYAKKIVKEKELDFYPLRGFMPVYNKKRKAFDIYSLEIELNEEDFYVEKEETRYDSINRAIQDIMIRYQNEFAKKGALLWKQK